jgi:hypothetical protein
MSELAYRPLTTLTLNTLSPRTQPTSATEAAA